MDFQNLVYPVLFFLVTLALGFWMRKSGKPYNIILFNVHKLAALAGVVLAGIWIRPIILVGDFSSWMIPVLGGAATTVLMLFASGAVMSIGGEGRGLPLFFHRAGPVIITLCLAGMTLLL